MKTNPSCFHPKLAGLTAVAWSATWANCPGVYPISQAGLAVGQMLTVQMPAEPEQAKSKIPQVHLHAQLTYSVTMQVVYIDKLGENCPRAFHCPIIGTKDLFGCISSSVRVQGSTTQNCARQCKHQKQHHSQSSDPPNDVKDEPC